MGQGGFRRLTWLWFRHFTLFSCSFFIRMVFSCLVDADFLDTERFMNPEKHALRESVERPGLPQLRDKLDAHLVGLAFD